MSKPQCELGRIVQSRAGRDAGRACVIVRIVDEHYVLIADGQMRKLSNPKKKKIKHLELKPVVLSGLKEKLEAAKPIFDSEVRKLLEPYNRNEQAGEE
nr:KOW domain-containing RNA-binding protein [Maliibacterium massiliense]